MQRLFRARSVLGVVVVAVIAASALLCVARSGDGRAAESSAPDGEAVERAHNTVKMLDALHKNYVVNITATYVKAQERTPAAHVAKKVFAQMEKDGWGTVRLIDATGAPVNKANVANSGFEKRALQKLHKGESYVSEVGRNNEGPVLRAATPVPVVMKQCISCHPGHKQGELLGALVYEVSIK